MALADVVEIRFVLKGAPEVASAAQAQGIVPLYRQLKEALRVANAAPGDSDIDTTPISDLERQIADTPARTATEFALKILVASERGDLFDSYFADGLADDARAVVEGMA